MTTYTVSWRDRDDTGHKITVHSLRAAQLVMANVSGTFYEVRLTRNTRSFNTVVLTLDGQPRKV